MQSNPNTTLLRGLRTANWQAHKNNQRRELPLNGDASTEDLQEWVLSHNTVQSFILLKKLWLREDGQHGNLGRGLASHTEQPGLCSIIEPC